MVSTVKKFIIHMQFVILFSKKRDSLKMSILPAWRQSYQILIFNRIFKGTTYIRYFSLTHRLTLEAFYRYVLYFRSLSLTLDFSKIFINILWGKILSKIQPFYFCCLSVWFDITFIWSIQQGEPTLSTLITIVTNAQNHTLST